MSGHCCFGGCLPRPCGCCERAIFHYGDCVDGMPNCVGSYYEGGVFDHEGMVGVTCQVCARDFLGTVLPLHPAEVTDG